MPVEYAGMTSIATQEVTACLLLSLALRRTNGARRTRGTARAAGQTGVAAPPGALVGPRQKLHQREAGGIQHPCAQHPCAQHPCVLSPHWEKHGALARREWGEANISHSLAPLRKRTEGGNHFLAEGKEQLVGPSAWCRWVLPSLWHWCKASTHFL